jgi:outer membrane lipoprotein-sorting protein
MRVAVPSIRLFVLLSSATALLTTVPSRAADAPAAGEILQQMKAALEPPKPSVRTMTMTFDDQGTKATFRLVQARKRLADGARAVTVLLEPAGARGIAYLTADAPGGSATEWLYVPYVQRTRKLVPAENNQSFMDTDFTYGDLGLLPVDTRNTLLDTETTDGRKSYKIESVPGSTVKQWYYSRTVTWIDAETLLPVRREFFSPAGDLFKVETFGAVTRIDGVPTPLETRITNVGTNTTTTLAITSISYDADLPDSLFQPESLSGIADAGVWKNTPAKPVPGK